MIIYRVVCKKERDMLIKNQSLGFSFLKKKKWFSSNLTWLKERVQDGKFNNSKFVEDRYEYLLEFDIDKKYLSEFSKIGYKEMMLNVRNSNFKINSIKEI
ncbi:hypothetical protein COB55_03615 [Candidatus Wolfebacteria bacterium]|nr:MAG: hypothetical protein COB55_03615 [Candidatus Wolfebacteria bacterium]